MTPQGLRARVIAPLALSFSFLFLAWPAAPRAQAVAPAPSVTATPLGPLGASPPPSPPASPQPSPQAAPQAAAPAAPEKSVWLPRHSAELQILDKVDATHETRDVAVGASVKVAGLTIAVGACLVRPPDQERDAAAYVDITDSNPAIQPFQGWLLAAEPAASVFEHPLYDVRVTGCD